MLWRRSYDVPPPPITDDNPWNPNRLPQYAALPAELVPRTECLKDVVERMLPYWYDGIVPDLQVGRTVLVAAHGNSLRALVKHLNDRRRGDHQARHSTGHRSSTTSSATTCDRSRVKPRRAAL
jgi:bisphosphoglycerate-dependent phosphoglycerate mutase family 1